MIWVDWCIAAVVLVSILFGVFRGFSREILNLFTWVLAVLLAWLMGDVLSEHMRNLISQPVVRNAAAHAALFMGGLLAGAIITHLLTDWVRNSVLNEMDRTLGGGFGFLRGLFIVALFILVAGTMGADKDRWWQRSVIVPHMEWLADGLKYLTPEGWLDKLKPDGAAESSKPQES